MNQTFTISKNDEPIRLTLSNFRSKQDGTSDVDIMYDDVFLKACKADLNKEDLTPADLGGYIAELIEKATHGLEGYKMEIEESEDSVK